MIVANKKDSLFIIYNTPETLDKIFVAKVSSNGYDFYSPTTGTTVSDYGSTITVGSSSFSLSSGGLITDASSYMVDSATFGDTLSTSVTASLDPLT